MRCMYHLIELKVVLCVPFFVGKKTPYSCMSRAGNPPQGILAVDLECQPGVVFHY